METNSTEQQGVATTEVVDTPAGQNINFSPIRAVIRPRTSKSEKVGVLGSLSVLGATIDSFNVYMENAPQLDIGRSLGTAEWAAAVDQAVNCADKGNMFKETVNRPGADWSQTISVEGDDIGPGRPRIAESAAGTLLTGDAALFKIQAELGLGVPFRQQMWHSGITLNFKPSGEDTLSELERRIAGDKNAFGRSTRGMGFGASDIYLRGPAINTALNHVYNSNYVTNDPLELMDILLITDIPGVLVGFLGAQYPSGYPLARPCVVDPSKCNHVTREQISFGNMYWCDRSRLTANQRMFFSKRDQNKKRTEAEVRAYQEEHAYNKAEVVQLSDNVSMILYVPSIASSLDSAYRWVDGIENATAEAFKHDLQSGERSAYLNRQAKATMMRSYAHWVKAFEFADGSRVEDRDTVDSILSSLSADDEIRVKFIEAVGKYIGAVTIAIAAVPSYVCPACNQAQVVENPVDRVLVPVDVVKTFFTLLGLVVTKVNERPLI